jgi:hypothetical protein
MFRPPKNDHERMLNLLEGLAEPGDGDDAFDEIMRAELARRGLTLETWAAQWARIHRTSASARASSTTSSLPSMSSLTSGPPGRSPRRACSRS